MHLYTYSVPNSLDIQRAFILWIYYVCAFQYLNMKTMESSVVIYLQPFDFPNVTV